MEDNSINIQIDISCDYFIFNIKPPRGEMLRKVASCHSLLIGRKRPLSCGYKICVILFQ